MTMFALVDCNSCYASCASEKLRAQKHLALSIHVFIHTSPFEPNYYSNSTALQLPYPTDDTREIVTLSRQAVRQLYRPGHAFLKAGVGLIDIVDRQFYQSDIFHPGQSARSKKLMKVIDGINREYGKGTTFLAAEGIRKRWYMRQQYRSQSYTTKWQDIPEVR